MMSASIEGPELSQRDCMMVAWHEVPGKATIMVPSRRERYDLWLGGMCRAETPTFKVVNQAQLVKPYPTGRIHRIVFPGTSCQATIIQSLRDEWRTFDACLAADLPITNH